jgi:hypothetical protein
MSHLRLIDHSDAGPTGTGTTGTGTAGPATPYDAFCSACQVSVSVLDEDALPEGWTELRQGGITRRGHNETCTRRILAVFYRTAEHAP